MKIIEWGEEFKSNLDRLDTIELKILYSPFGNYRIMRKRKKLVVEKIERLGFMDTGTTLTIVFGVIGTILAVVGLFSYNKKNTVVVKPKTKNGDIDLSNSIIGNEINKKNDSQ